MSHIHLVGGEKGGVGKSVVARLLAQRFIDADLPFAAIDADVSHGALLRYYGEYTQAVDLEQQASADSIMDRALGADRSVLVDLPAQSVRLLLRWLEGADVLSFARQLQVGVTFWFVTDGGFDSARQFETLLATFGDQMNYVAVKNHGRGRDFSQFDMADGMRRLTALGGKVLELAELEPSTMYAIDRCGSSFWAAANNADGPHALAPLQRQRARLWLAQQNRRIDALNALA
ncbi:MAG: hypothetical protein RJA70_3633 [Pseudomonadota bacterium]